MKNWGYVLALLLGGGAGWLAQQFWIMERQLTAQDRVATQQALRNGERLDKLQARQNDVTKAPDARSIEPTSTIDAERSVASLFESELNFDADLTALKTLAGDWLASKRYSELLDVVYELRLRVSYDNEDQYFAWVYSLVDEVDQVLSDAEQWPQLIAVYRQVIALHPDNVAYTIRLATIQIERGRFDEARESLIVARNDPEYSVVAEAMLQDIDEREQLASNAMHIPLEKRGKHYVVRTRINNSWPASLLVDTGASVSVVKSAWLREAGLDGLPSESLVMTTANGKIEGQKVVVDQLEMNGLVLRNVELGVVPLPDFKHDGLLGMNVLGQFQFYVDSQQNQLLLRAK